MKRTFHIEFEGPHQRSLKQGSKKPIELCDSFSAWLIEREKEEQPLFPRLVASTKWFLGATLFVPTPVGEYRKWYSEREGSITLCDTGVRAVFGTIPRALWLKVVNAPRRERRAA